MKLRVRDVLLIGAAAVTALFSCWSVISNIGTPSVNDMGETMPIWYLAVRNLMFVMLGIWAVIRIVSKHGEAICNVLRIAVLVLSGIFTVLVVVDASPLVSLFISQKLWNDTSSMVNIVTYILYLAIGMIAFGLCWKRRERTENTRSLGTILAIVVGVNALPTVFYIFRLYGENASMFVPTIVLMVVQALLQAVTVYGVFGYER